MERAGCELTRFSPLHDRSLPEALDAIYLGGGYPEEYAEALASNATMLDSIKSFAASGKPVYAECGGLMYLGRGIELRDGKRFELVGILPAWTKMLDRLKSLGYVEVTLAEDSLFGKRGSSFKGHEFHYSELLENPSGHDGWSSVYRINRRRVDAVADEGFQFGKVLASYVHAHLASKPELMNHFVSLCQDK
jgi:cobyrinic acid a,c-diamide synthase